MYTCIRATLCTRWLCRTVIRGKSCKIFVKRVGEKQNYWNLDLWAIILLVAIAYTIHAIEMTMIQRKCRKILPRLHSHTTLCKKARLTFSFNESVATLCVEYTRGNRGYFFVEFRPFSPLRAVEESNFSFAVLGMLGILRNTQLYALFISC